MSGPGQSTPSTERPPVASEAAQTPNSADLFPTLPPDPHATQAPPPVSPEAAAETPTLGEYEVLGILGHGGMGVVYRAYDKRRRSQVALKTIRLADPDVEYRFKQEFRHLCELRHPNIVKLYEAFSHGRQWYFTMELVEGVSVQTYLTGSPDDPPESRWTRLRSLLLQLVEVVRFLHTSDRLHRDLKPSNLLVRPSGQLVLLDFGLMTQLDARGQHLSTYASIVGTPAYMAPEQAAGQAVSAASDWYSVGMMLYELLTGKLPYGGNMTEFSLTRPAAKELPAPSSVVPGVPADLEKLCLGLLRPNPAERLTGEDLAKYIGPVAPLEKKPILQDPLFVGREEQLAVLQDAVEAMRSGQTLLIGVRGSSGVGKSALLRRFLEQIEAQSDTVVLQGRCYEQESAPYKALDSLVDALSHYLRKQPENQVEALLPRDVLLLARVFSALQRVPAVARAPQRHVHFPDPQELRRRAFRALRELLGRLADRKPLIIAIDDLQWGDFDSAVQLIELIRPPQPPPLLLVACYRIEDVGTSPCLKALQAAIESMTSEVELRRVTLPPLSPEEAKALATQLLGQHATTEAVAQIAEESQGNPYFVQEFVHALECEGSMLAPTDRMELDEVIWQRIRRLSEEVQRILELLAVAGKPLAVNVLLRAAGLPNQQAGLEELRFALLVRSVAGVEEPTVMTYHDRIRETVVDHLPADVQARHHLSLGLALEELHGNVDPETLAAHFDAAGAPTRAAPYYERAAQQASDAWAFDQAARFYRLALQSGSPDGAQRAKLLELLAHALANAGRGFEAAQAYQEASAAAPSETRFELRRRAAMEYLISGHLTEGAAILRELLKEVRLGYPTSSVKSIASILGARLMRRFLGARPASPQAGPALTLNRLRADLCWAAVRGLANVDYVRGGYFNMVSLRYALKTGDPSRIVRTLTLEATLQSTPGSRRSRHVDYLLQQAANVAQRVEDPANQGFLHLARGVIEYLCGNWRAGLTSCDEAERIFREQCTGMTWELDTCRTYALWSLIPLGEMAELTARVHQLLPQAKARGDRYAVSNFSTYVAAMVYLTADQPERMQQLLDEVQSESTGGEFHIQHHNIVLGQVSTYLYQHQAEKALQYLESRLPWYRRTLLWHVQQTRMDVVTLQVRCALAAAVEMPARRESLLQMAEKHVRQFLREKSPYCTAYAMHFQACVRACRDDKATAIQGFRDAVSRFAQLDMKLYAAVAERRLFQLLDSKEQQSLMFAEYMTQQDIKKPELMTDLLAPGCFR